MPTRFVRQPDGLLAVYSTVCSDFTHYAMTETEALAFGTEEWGKATAEQKVASALSDKLQVGTGDGLGRWREALTGIACEHGLQGLRTTLSEIGFPDAEIPESALQIVAQVEADRREDGVARP